MMCFRDITHCSAYGTTCGNSRCHRALTDDVWRRARIWWGGDDVPVMVDDYSETCTEKEPVH